MKAIYNLDVPLDSKALKPSSQTEDVPQGKKPGAKSILKRKRSSKHIFESTIKASKSQTGQSKKETKTSSNKDKSPSHPSLPTLVVGEMHKKAQQSVGGLTSLGATCYCRFCDSCCYVHDANACLGTTNNGSNRDRMTSNNTINELLQKLLQQLEGMNVHTTVSPFTNTTSIPNVAFYTGSPNHSSPSVSLTYPPSFPAQTNSNYITGPYPSLPPHAPLAHLNPTGFVSSQVHTFVQPNGTHNQPAPHPVNLGHTTLSGQATNLPHAFNTETLQELSSDAWNIDTGASSHPNSLVTSLNTIFNTCMYPSISVGDGQSIPITNTGHSILPTPTKSLHLNNVLITPHIVKNLIFVCDNNCTIEFNAFGFFVKDFLTRRVLLRCDSTGDLYPVTAPSPIHHAFLVSQHTWHQRLGHPGGEVLYCKLLDHDW
nr:ribonuclease H-like domain-containing protein [Tanacetum cinerariifolium]